MRRRRRRRRRWRCRTQLAGTRPTMAKPLMPYTVLSPVSIHPLPVHLRELILFFFLFTAVEAAERSPRSVAR